MPHDARQLVLRSLPVFLAHASADWPTVLRELQALGLSRNLAMELGALVPIAFGRLLLMSKGIYADPRCARVGTTPLKYEDLNSLPVYTAALDVGRELFFESDRLTYQQYIAIAGWSAELNAADRMMDEGRHPFNIMIGPALVYAPGTDEPFDEGPITAEIVE